MAAGLRQLVPNPLPAAAERQQVHLEPLAEQERFQSLADQQWAIGDHGLGSFQLVILAAGFRQLGRTGQLEATLVDHRLERNRISLQDQQVVCVKRTANQAFDAATRIVDLFKRDRDRITTESERTGSALRVHDLLQQNPFAVAHSLAKRTGLSAPTINAALADLMRLGVVVEVTGRRRGRVFGYRAYLDILNEGTAPLPVG